MRIARHYCALFLTGSEVVRNALKNRTVAIGRRRSKVLQLISKRRTPCRMSKRNIQDGLPMQDSLVSRCKDLLVAEIPVEIICMYSRAHDL